MATIRKKVYEIVFMKLLRCLPKAHSLYKDDKVYIFTAFYNFLNDRNVEFKIPEVVKTDFTK